MTGGPAVEGPAADAPVRRLAEAYSSLARDYADLWAPVILALAVPLLGALPLRRARRIVDIGTGVGGLLPRLRDGAADARIVGVDRSGGMIRMARERHGFPVATMDARALALPDGAFDVATLAFMLFHVPRPSDALVEAGRVLRRGGAVGLVTWAEGSLDLPTGEIWTEELDRHGAGPDPGDVRVRRHDLVDRPEKLSRLLEGAGFGSIEVWARRFERRWDAESLIVVQAACGAEERRLATLEPGARSACVAAVRDRTAAMSPERLAWRPVVLYASAVRN